MEKNKQAKSAELYEWKPGQTVDVSDQAFEELHASLKRIEGLKQEIATGILRAKKQNLVEYVEKFRTMLRRLVAMENALLEETSQKESAKLARDLDLLEAEFAKDIKVTKRKAVSLKPKSKHAQTATRYGIAAGLIGFGGVFACLLGCIAYLLFVQIEGMGVTFEWIWPAVNAAGVLLFVVIGAILSRRSRVHSLLAKKELAQLEAEEQKKADRLAEEASALAVQAYAVELNLENQEKQLTETVDIKGKPPVFSVKRTRSDKEDGIDVRINGASWLLLTATLTGAGALVAAFLAGRRSCGKKKKKASQKSVSPIKPSAPKKNAPETQSIVLHVED